LSAKRRILKGTVQDFTNEIKIDLCKIESEEQPGKLYDEVRKFLKGILFQLANHFENKGNM
jgi:hypothetical protein